MYLPHWPIPSTLINKEIDYEAVFDRMGVVLEKLGNPHLMLRNVVHIAGTNGKGSSAAFLGEIFKQSGYQAHIYTSPHLHDCNERIMLQNEKISDGLLYEFLEEVRHAAENSNVDLTFMEAFTITAFLAFSKIKSDIIIIECGMGGRIDSTNIIQHKLATLITPISFDHQEYLGNNIERIALEKAMIMRPNTPLIVSAQSKKARDIIKILAQDQNIDNYFYGEDFDIALDEDSHHFDFMASDCHIKNLPKPSLRGQHQYINCASIIALLQTINHHYNISEDSIKAALHKTYWPGRLENITHMLKKYCPSSDIFIDGAHNPSGAFALAQWIKQENHYQHNVIICGFSRDKCSKEFLMHFKNLGEIIAVRVEGEPYPEDTDTISKIATQANIEVTTKEDLFSALHYVNNVENSRIIICGSLHLNRDVLSLSRG